MFSKKKISVLVLIVLALLLAACAPAASPAPEPVSGAQQWLADELGVPVEEVEIVSSEEVEWSDSCLGLGGPAESCAAVITPGWQVILLVDGTEYEVRTDEAGSQYRLAPPA